MLYVRHHARSIKGAITLMALVPHHVLYYVLYHVTCLIFVSMAIVIAFDKELYLCMAL